MIRNFGPTLAPVVAAIALAALSDLPAQPLPQLGCRILPNAMVPVMTGRTVGCVLKPYDRIIAASNDGHRSVTSGAELQRRLQAAADAGRRSIEVLVIRRGDEHWISVPIVHDTRGQIIGRFAGALLISAMVMAISLMIRAGSSQAAARPFAYFYSCVSVVLVSVLCGRYSNALVIPGVVAAGLVPATLAHLALTFPKERDIVRRVPQVVVAIYSFSGLLTFIAVANLTRSPTVWALADRSILVLSILTWSLLVTSCVLSVRESRSALERARARVLLAGSATIPAVPLVLGLWFGSVVPGGTLALMTITVAVLPLPVGYAISHYRLFDLGFDLRRAIAYVLYVAASAAIISGIVVGLAVGLGRPILFGDPVVLFTVVLVGFLVADPLRARLRGAIDGWMAPGRDRMATSAAEHVARVAGLIDPDECARLLCQTVGRGVDPKGVSVFLSEEGGWRLADAAGVGAPVRSEVAGTAAKAVAGRELLCLADEESDDGAQTPLCELGVEIVASLERGDKQVGLMLVLQPRRGSSYTTPQLRFVETVAKQSAVAIHSSNLARDLAVSERLATQGRLGAGLIHDLGKPLGVIERLAARLPPIIEDRTRLLRDVGTIADLAAQMRRTLREFLEATQRAASGGPDPPVEIDALVDRAVRIVERQHGRGRVSVRLQPDLPPLRGGGGKLVRALANLLDNALLASDRGDVVEVAAAPGNRSLGIAVIDRGCGMDESTLAHAFEPFFTTRFPSHGHGLGLTVCRDLMDGLGGSVELTSEPGRGTRARLVVPTGPGSGA